MFNEYCLCVHLRKLQDIYKIGVFESYSFLNKHFGMRYIVSDCWCTFRPRNDPVGCTFNILVRITNGMTKDGEISPNVFIATEGQRRQRQQRCQQRRQRRSETL